MEKMALAVFGWGKPAAEALKNATEIVGVNKARCLRDFGYGQVFFQQQALGTLNAVLVQVTDRGNPHFLGKSLVHIGNGEMNQISQRALREGIGIMFVNVVADAENALTDVLYAVVCPTLPGGVERKQSAENAEHAVALVHVPIKGERQRLAEQSNRFMDIVARKNARIGRHTRFREVGGRGGTRKFDPVLLEKTAVGVNGVALNGFGRKKKGTGGGKRNAANHAASAHDIVQNPDGTGHIAGVIACGRVASADFQNAERCLTDNFRKKDFGCVFPNVGDNHSGPPLTRESRRECAL